MHRVNQFFPYDFDLRFFAIWRALGADPSKDGVTLAGDRFLATFGRWSVDTPLDNVKCAQITGPYRWWRSVGLRGSGTDSGITFGTTSRPGVCVLFKERIPRVVPTAPTHAGLTVTVADPNGLVTVLKGIVDG